MAGILVRLVLSIGCIAGVLMSQRNGLRHRNRKTFANRPTTRDSPSNMEGL